MVNQDVCQHVHIHAKRVARVADDLPEDEMLYDPAELFKLFGDSTRVKIPYALFESELCVCDAAIEAADVVLMDDDPAKPVTAVTLARKTRRIATENIVFALSVKFLVLALSALGLTAMWWAVFADVGVAVLAILNTGRMLRK